MLFFESSFWEYHKNNYELHQKPSKVLLIRFIFMVIIMLYTIYIFRMFYIIYNPACTSLFCGYFLRFLSEWVGKESSVLVLSETLFGEIVFFLDYYFRFEVFRINIDTSKNVYMIIRQMEKLTPNQVLTMNFRKFRTGSIPFTSRTFKEIHFLTILFLNMLSKFILLVYFLMIWIFFEVLITVYCVINFDWMTFADMIMFVVDTHVIMLFLYLAGRITLCVVFSSVLIFQNLVIPLRLLPRRFRKCRDENYRYIQTLDLYRKMYPSYLKEYKIKDKRIVNPLFTLILAFATVWSVPAAAGLLRQQFSLFGTVHAALLLGVNLGLLMIIYNLTAFTGGSLTSSSKYVSSFMASERASFPDIGFRLFSYWKLVEQVHSKNKFYFHIAYVAKIRNSSALTFILWFCSCLMNRVSS